MRRLTYDVGFIEKFIRFVAKHHGFTSILIDCGNFFFFFFLVDDRIAWAAEWKGAIMFEICTYFVTMSGNIDGFVCVFKRFCASVNLEGWNKCRRQGYGGLLAPAKIEDRSRRPITSRQMPPIIFASPRQTIRKRKLPPFLPSIRAIIGAILHLLYSFKNSFRINCLSQLKAHSL